MAAADETIHHYRLTCCACGHRGAPVVGMTEWGLLKARWSGFGAGRLSGLRPANCSARCGRCGRRMTVVREAAARPGEAGGGGQPARCGRWARLRPAGAFAATAAAAASRAAAGDSAGRIAASRPDASRSAAASARPRARASE
jgi:hypothetical protein